MYALQAVVSPHLKVLIKGIKHRPTKNNDSNVDTKKNNFTFYIAVFNLIIKPYNSRVVTRLKIPGAQTP